MEKEKNGCVSTLIIGIAIGLITGSLLGINYATWKYANIISLGYSEIIRTHAGGMFVKEKGLLYKLEPIESKEQAEKNILDDIDQHDQNTMN